MEKMQRMRLQHLAKMQQAAQLFSRRGESLHTDQLIHRLGRRQLMADRTDAAQALHEERYLPVRAALDEFLETAKFDDVQARFMDMIFGIQHQRDFAVPLDARDGIDGNAPEIG